MCARLPMLFPHCTRLLLTAVALGGVGNHTMLGCTLATLPAELGLVPLGRSGHASRASVAQRYNPALPGPSLHCT